MIRTILTRGADREAFPASIEIKLGSALLSVLLTLPATAALAATGSTALLAIGLSIPLVAVFRALRIAVVLTDGHLVVRNYFRTYRILWQDVISVEPSVMTQTLGPALDYGEVGIVAVKTRLPANFRWANTNPTPMEQRFQLNPLRIINTRERFTILASNSLGARKKARLVNGLRRYASKALVPCHLTDEDLDSHEHHWTMRKKLPNSGERK